MPHTQLNSSSIFRLVLYGNEFIFLPYAVLKKHIVINYFYKLSYDTCQFGPDWSAEFCLYFFFYLLFEKVKTTRLYLVQDFGQPGFTIAERRRFDNILTQCVNTKRKLVSFPLFHYTFDRYVLYHYIHHECWVLLLCLLFMLSLLKEGQ